MGFGTKNILSYPPIQALARFIPSGTYKNRAYIGLGTRRAKIAFSLCKGPGTWKDSGPSPPIYVLVLEKFRALLP